MASAWARASESSLSDSACAVPVRRSAVSWARLSTFAARSAISSLACDDGAAAGAAGGASYTGCGAGVGSGSGSYCGADGADCVAPPPERAELSS
jgi:hypothetical protein